MRTILVPTDFSRDAQEAFETAYDLARQLGAAICLIHVQDMSSLRRAVQEGLLQKEATDETIRAEVAKLAALRFSQMLSGLGTPEVVIETRVVRGDIDAAIVGHAIEIGADLIVMGPRGLGALGKIKATLVGSVTRSVLAKAPCPVLVVPRCRRQ